MMSTYVNSSFVIQQGYGILSIQDISAPRQLSLRNWCWFVQTFQHWSWNVHQTCRHSSTGAEMSSRPVGTSVQRSVTGTLTFLPPLAYIVHRNGNSCLLSEKACGVFHGVYKYSTGWVNTVECHLVSCSTSLADHGSISVGWAWST